MTKQEITKASNCELQELFVAFIPPSCTPSGAMVGQQGFHAYPLSVSNRDAQTVPAGKL